MNTRRHGQSDISLEMSRSTNSYTDSAAAKAGAQADIVGPQETEAGEAGWLQQPARAAQQYRQENRGRDQQRSQELEEKKTKIEAFSTAVIWGEEQTALRWVVRTAQCQDSDPQGLRAFQGSPVKDLLLHVALWGEPSESSSA